MLWVDEKKNEKERTGIYFGKRKRNNDSRKVRGRKDKGPHEMLELRTVLGWKLRGSERENFRSCCYPCGEC